MEASPYHQWLASREHYRTVLFGESPTPYDDEAMMSLAALARQTKRNKRYSAAERYAREELHESVAALLSYHDKTARRGDPALFAVKGPEELLWLTELTSDVVWRWEEASKAHDQPSPFEDLPVHDIQAADFERPDVQLTIEAAAAACHVAAAGYHVNDRRLARLIAHQGPAFATAWVQGEIIRDHCTQSGQDAEPWLNALTIRQRMEVALNTANDPLGKFIEIYRHLTETLSTPNIARVIEWNTEDVEATFTPSSRKHIAMRHKNPEAKLAEIAQQLATHLSTEQLAARYDYTLKETVDRIPLTLRVEAMLNRPADPLAQLDAFDRHLRATLSIPNIASELGWTEEQVHDVFRPSVLRLIARRHVHDPLDAIYRMARNVNFLDSGFLAQQLGKTPKYIDAVFTTIARRRIIQNADPLAAAQLVISTTNLLRNYALPDGLIRKLAATHSPKSARKIAEQIMKEQAKRPRGVRADVWAWTIATYPKGDSAKRMKYISAYLILRRIQSPIALEAIGKSDPLHRQIGDSTYDPAEISATADPSDELEALANKAGVSPVQIQELLSHFEGNEDAPDRNNLKLLEALQKLRAAAKRHT